MLLLRSPWSGFHDPNRIRFGCIWQFVSDIHSATVRVTSAVITDGGCCASLLPK
jgi:hypothetical protein